MWGKRGETCSVCDGNKVSAQSSLVSGPEESVHSRWTTEGTVVVGLDGRLKAQRTSSVSDSTPYQSQHWKSLALHPHPHKHVLSSYSGFEENGLFA